MPNALPDYVIYVVDIEKPARVNSISYIMRLDANRLPCFAAGVTPALDAGMILLTSESY